MKRGNLLFLVSLLALIIFISSCEEDLHPNGKNNTTNNNGTCVADVKTCSNGAVLQRQPPNCEFPACPTTNNSVNNNTSPCPTDKKSCWGVGNVSRIPPKCEFESCAKYGIPPNTCNYSPDCKIVMSMCSCEAVPVDDPRDWINGSYCSYSECIYDDELIAKARCENNICIKVIDNNSIKGSLYVTTNPSGANVYLNNNNRGTSPLLISVLSQGVYSLDAVLNSAGRSYSTVNVTGRTQTNISLTLSPTCVDSDNGLAYDIFGTVQSTNNGVITPSVDVCKDSSNLTEQYCEYAAAILANSTDYTCPNGCSNGACVP